MPRLPLALLAAAVAGLSAAAPAHAAQPALIGRALLPANATSPAPFAGVPNTDPAPAPGSTQPVGGFSALLDAPGRDMYWAMPDNGFGNKANSRSFLLRLYKVRADWGDRTRRPRCGEDRGRPHAARPGPPHPVCHRRRRHRRPPAHRRGLRHRIRPRGPPWRPLVRRRVRALPRAHRPHRQGARGADRAARRQVAGLPARLPGAIRRAPRTSTAPTASKAWRSPPTAPRSIRRSRAPSPATTRRRAGCTRSTWPRTATPARAAATASGCPATPPRPGCCSRISPRLDDTHLVSLERDDDQGLAARWKRGFVVDLARSAPDGSLAKRQIVNLLDLRDRAGISLPGRPGDIGLGDPFSMPYVTIEAVLPLGGNRLGIVNDTNFGSTGRNPGLPDYSDFIQVRVPGLRRDDE